MNEKYVNLLEVVDKGIIAAHHYGDTRDKTGDDASLSVKVSTTRDYELPW